MVFRLDKEYIFPDPSLANEDGLLAVGGDLETGRLILAYRQGIFPWFSEGGPICWYAPHERCVIYPDKVFISKSMQKILDKKKFEIRTDTAFEEVIVNCRSINRKDQAGTWISEEMKEAYIKLHHLGIAHSIEAWQNGVLSGGLYGLKINEVFCGESMFTKVSNASKAALLWLCQNGGYSLIDCQLPNDHLMSLGATLISQQAFIKTLQVTVK